MQVPMLLSQSDSSYLNMSSRKERHIYSFMLSHIYDNLYVLMYLALNKKLSVDDYLPYQRSRTSIYQRLLFTKDF